MGYNLNDFMDDNKKKSRYDLSQFMPEEPSTPETDNGIPGEGSPEIKRLASELFVDAPVAPPEPSRPFFKQVANFVKNPMNEIRYFNRKSDEQYEPVRKELYPQLYPEPGAPTPQGSWFERTGQAGSEVMGMMDRPDKVTTGSKFGDISADLAGGLMGFAGNPASAGAKLWGGTEQAISGALPLIPKLNVLPAIAQTGLKMGATTLPYEATRAIANDRPFDAGEAGTAAASNALLGMLLHGGGKALASFRRPGEVPGVESTLPTLEAPPGVNTAPQKSFTSLRLPGTEKTAMDRLNEGIQEAQNYVKHNDVLAAYPPGTTVEAALADIKANTGIDLPRLMNDVEAIQGRPGLRQQVANEAQFSRLGQAAGAIPELAKFVGPGRERIIGGSPSLRVTPPMVQPVRGTLPQGISPMSMQPPDTLGTITSKSDRGPIDINRIIRQTYSKTVDTQNRLNDVDKYVSSTIGRSLPPQDKLYMNAMNQKGADQTARYILEEGMVDAKGDAAGPSFKEVVKSVPSGKWREFEDYLKLNNFKAWEAEGKTVYDKNLNMNEIFADRKIADYEAKYPWMKQASQNYTGWINQFGEKWLVDTGLVSRDGWNAMRVKYKDYIPFQRLMDETELGVGTGRAKGAFAEQPNPVKKAMGSERKTIESVETMIERIPAYVKAAKRNEVMVKLIDHMKEDPQGMAPWGEIVTSDTAHLTMPNVVAGRINGERVHVKVSDPQLLDALTKLSPTGQNVVVEAVRQVTRTMKVLTTGVNPMFSLARNIFRDLPTSYVASKSTNNPITWGRDILGSVVDILRNKDIYKSYKAMGGGHSSSIATDRNILAESKARIQPGYFNPKNPLQMAGRLGKAAFGGLERLANVTETAPRLAEYRRIVRQGGGSYESKVKGLFEANDLTVNFSRSGEISKGVDAFIPYFNAAVQGLDKFARIYKDNPVQGIVKSVAAVTIPTIVMYAINHNDPNYNRLANWVKDNNFLIPKGDGTFIKIPKPREVGVIFGSSVERAMKQWSQGDPKGFEDFSKTIITNFAPPVRPIFMPFVDVARNKNFAGSTIVPGYMQNLSPQLQADENTSSISKWLGAQLGKSPKQIDYLVRSYTGVIGQLGIPALSEGGSMKETLIRQVTADPVYSNDIVNKFYEKKKDLETNASDAKFTGGQNEPIEVKQRKLYGKIAETISDTRDQMRAIEKNPALTDEAKKERLRGMQAAIVTMAEIANKSESEQMGLYNILKRKGKIEETKPVSPAKQALDLRNEQKKYKEMTGILMK